MAGGEEILTRVREAERSQSAAWTAALGPTRIVFGAGALRQIGSLARDLGARCALIVTDPGLRAAGHVDRAHASLDRASVRTVLFDDVAENPTTAHVERGARLASGHPIDLIVGLGGGSAMDCAKGINFLLTNGGRMEDYWGSNLARSELLPSIGVPTTAGTGSEAQSFALIEQEGTRRKMACGDERAKFRLAVLDPELTATMPRRVAAQSAMDAVSHAVESYVTSTRNPLSQLYAREAWRLLSSGFDDAIGSSADAATRGRMMLGALLAGAAIEASMLGAAHACANPLTSRYGIAHGTAVLLMLPHVVRYNEAVVAESYGELLSLAQARDGSGAGPASGPGLAERLESMRRRAGLPERLSEAGVPASDLPELAAEAESQWTARHNPRPVDRADLLELYEKAY